ncbi:MAG: DUF2085 domain-containing protein [Ignavibacterium sp.]|nr:DUF2085 domain-containing protein [Ignavibacterium sp.]
MSKVLIFFKKNVRIIFFSGLLIWTTGIFVPCLRINSPVLYFLSDLFYSTICHQSQIKSISCNNDFLFVCSRCLGIYIGALVLSASLLFFKKKYFQLKLLPLIISIIPVFLDVMFVKISIYDYSHTISFITGLLFGSTVFVYILSVIENSFVETVKGK